MKWIVPAALGLTACGRINFEPPGFDPGGGPGEQHGGARLRIVWQEYEGGARERWGIFDSVRGEACNIVHWDDGVVRCTPQVQPSSGVDYLDPLCTMPVGWATSLGVGCPTPGYFAAGTRDDPKTGDIRAVYPATGPHADASYYLFDDVNGCYGPSSGGGPLFGLGPEITKSELAEIVTTTSGTGRLVQGYYTSADGFRMDEDIHDTQLALSCAENPGPGGSLVCSPQVSDPGQVRYSDPACAVPAGCVVSATAPAPRFIIGKASNVCAPAGQWFTAASAASARPSSLYDNSNAYPACAAAGLPGGTVFYAIAQELDVPPLQRVVEGSGRVAEIYDLADDLHTPVQGLYDRMFDTPCATGIASDGSLRCIPSRGDTLLRHLFTDAACTSPITVSAQYHFPNCASSPRAAVASGIINQVPCSTQVRYESYRIGAAHLGALYESQGSCVAADARYVYFDATGLISPDELAPSTRALDPAD